MKTHARKLNRRISLLALLGVIALLLIPTLVTANFDTAVSQLQSAWQKATDIGSYAYQANTVQTIHPTAKVENIGRAPQTQHLNINGEINLHSEALQLEIQSGDNAPLAIKVEDGITYGRSQETEAWQEMDEMTELFAPGGDPLSYLTAVENVQILDNTADSTFLSEELLPDTYFASLTRYTFDINGAQYAQFMRNQLEQQLRQQGELPAGMHLETSQIYKDMVGNGEIWINEAGLPVRQMIHLQFPPQENASEWVEAQITSEFNNWATGTAGILNQLQHNPQQLFKNPLALTSISVQDIQLTGFLFGISLLVIAFFAYMLTQRRSRKLHAILSFTIIFPMLTTPFLQGQQLHAYYDDQQAEQASYRKNQSAQQEQDALQAELNGSNFNPLSPPQLIPAAPQLQSAPVCALPGDTDCDGDEDNDNDGLTDYMEVNELGTDPDFADTDGDFISDKAEVVGYFGSGRQWYLNPLHPDSNGDGLPDTIECADLV
ncbi:MAG: hypothetical protein GY943_28560, partial [Chloroflexi bacterium]|nr:hypothetical protein [Chloroflexota bacterium]